MTYVAESIMFRINSIHDRKKQQLLDMGDLLAPLVEKHKGCFGAASRTYIVIFQLCDFPTLCVILCFSMYQLYIFTLGSLVGLAEIFRKFCVGSSGPLRFFVFVGGHVN